MNWLFVRPLRPFITHAAGVSLLLNIALLAPAIYMLQVFDRVFASNSVETLVMLSLLALSMLALSYFLDTVRARTLAWAGRSIERKLSPVAVRHALEMSTQAARIPKCCETPGNCAAFLAGRVCWRYSMRRGCRSIY